VLFLGDIFPPAGRPRCSATSSRRHGGDLGRGPSGRWRSAARPARREAGDRHRPLPERLSMAAAGGAITINFEQDSVLERLNA
jgi:hypothetical protein